VNRTKSRYVHLPTLFSLMHINGYFVKNQFGKVILQNLGKSLFWICIPKDSFYPKNQLSANQISDSTRRFYSFFDIKLTMIPKDSNG
jgi:hypothetical protein